MYANLLCFSSLYSFSDSRFAAPSVAPSDSISRQNSGSTTPTISTPIHQPAVRPAEYPVQILWAFEDCKDDPDVGLTPSNPSRPPMERSIRHADGSLISPAEYSSIRASARLVISDLLAIPRPKNRSARTKPRTKSYFRAYFPREWQRAVEKLERHQPLLALCTAHWKAEHVIGNALLKKPSGAYNDEDIDDHDDHDDNDNDNDAGINPSSQTTGNKRPRGATDPSPRKKRRVPAAESEVGSSTGSVSNISRSRPRSTLNQSTFLSRLSQDGTPSSGPDTLFIKVDPHGKPPLPSIFFWVFIYHEQWII